MNRIVTSLILISLTSIAIIRGWDIVKFVYRTSLSQPIPSDAYRTWFGVPGVTIPALEAALSETAAATDVDATQRRAELLTEFLAVRPLSAAQWLSLAGMRLATALPEKDALAALAMSSITGPNEAGVMWPRGIFGLLQWERLPPDARERTVADLSGAVLAGALDETEVSETKTVVATKSPEVRSQIKSMLIAGGVSPAALNGTGL